MMKFLPTVIVLASAYMTIQAPDKPVTVDEVKMSRAGDNLTLVVAVKGDFPVKYQWYLHEKPLPGADHSTIVLNRVMTEAIKNGALYCSVSNCGGKYHAIGSWNGKEYIGDSDQLLSQRDVSPSIMIHDIRR